MTAVSLPLQTLDDLLNAVRRDGDERAWTALVVRLTPPLYRVARGLTAWRSVGAQTVVERAWRVAARTPEATVSGAALRRALFGEVVRRALAAGDSPAAQHDGEPPARLAAMRAVTLLPQPSRSVFVLAELGGLGTAPIAELLQLPEARVKSELWHARLTVETLRGTGGTPTPMSMPAVTPDADGAPDPSAGEAWGGEMPAPPLWQEPTPEALTSRIAADLRSRAIRRRGAPGLGSGRRPLFGGALIALLLGGGVAVWREAADTAPPRARTAERMTDAAPPSHADATVPVPTPVDSALTDPAEHDVPRTVGQREEPDSSVERHG